MNDRTSIQESATRTLRPEAPVDSMLKDMASIIFSTFLLAGWVAFVIIYPKVSQIQTSCVLLMLHITIYDDVV